MGRNCWALIRGRSDVYIFKRFLWRFLDNGCGIQKGIEVNYKVIAKLYSRHEVKGKSTNLRYILERERKESE